MYSQCPECLTRFRVTADALRAAHGTVRCGRCGSAFDALARLSDQIPDAAEPANIAPGATLAAPDSDSESPRDDGTRMVRAVADPGAAEFHFSADDIEQVFVDSRDWQRRFGTPLAPDIVEAGSPETSPTEARDNDESSAAAAASSQPVFVHEPESVEDITLEGERIVIDGITEFEDELYEGDQPDAVPLPAPPGGEETSQVDLESTDRFEVLKHVPDSAYPTLREDEPAAGPGEPAGAEFIGAEPVPGSLVSPASLTPEPPAASSTIAPAANDEAGTERRSRWEMPLRASPAAAAAQAEAAAELDLTADEAPPGHRRSALAWGIGALLLALALTAQLTHYYRQQLARDANVGPLVRQVYAQLGLPLAPNWDLDAFELRQWGASESAPAPNGRMTVRASLRNGASFAQPMPLLRLELEDRFGETVARRDFEPGEYLKDPAQATRMLAPDVATEAELAIVNAATDAVGYRLDVCMRDEAGAVRCAQPTSDDALR